MICPCYLCFSTRDPSSGAFISGLVGKKKLVACIDTGATYTSINERFVGRETRFTCEVKLACANGQEISLTEYVIILVSLTPEFTVELQCLVTPDSPSSPDMLIGRDSLSRLGATISLTESLLDLNGHVLLLHSTIDEAASKRTLVIPSPDLLSSSKVRIHPGEFMELGVTIQGPILVKHYTAISYVKPLLILFPVFDLYPWRCFKSDDPPPSFCIYVHNTGRSVLEFEASQCIGKVTPMVISKNARINLKPLPTPVVQERMIKYSQRAPSGPGQAFSQSVSPYLPPDRHPIRVDESVSPAYAFPFAHPNDADESYHSGCCLVPRVLSDAERVEWKKGIEDRRAHWASDNHQTLLAHFTLGDVPPEILPEFKSLIEEFSSVFGRNLNDIRTGMVRFMAHLAVKDPDLVMYSSPKNLNILLSEATANYAKILVKAKVAEPSFSPHAANSFVVGKKEKLPTSIAEIRALPDERFLATYRLVHAFIRLNQNLLVSNHTVASLRTSILGSKPNRIYSSVDFLQSYFQILVSPECRDLLAFHCTGMDALLRLCRLAMGLSTSAQLLAGYMYRIKVDHHLEDCLDSYHDDVNLDTPGWNLSRDELEVPSSVPGQTVVPNTDTGLNKLEAYRGHLGALRRFLTACVQENIILNPKKCSFFHRSMDKLGFHISPLGISVPDKTREAILALKPPESRTEVRSLLGLTNTISQFVPSYQELVGPLYDLTSTRKAYVWTEVHQKAFDNLKKVMFQLPLLGFFHYENGRNLVLYTDASDTAGGAILMLELDSGARLPLSYSSYKFPASSLKQSIFRKEFYSLAAALRKNVDILSCVHFDLYVDSKALFFALSNPKIKLTEQIFRLSAFVQSFAFTPHWIPTKSNVSDILTRQVDLKALPDLDLTFLAEFQKDITVLGWKDEDETVDPVVPVYSAIACSKPFWDLLPKLDDRDKSHPCVSFFKEEKFAGPPGSSSSESGPGATLTREPLGPPLHEPVTSPACPTPDACVPLSPVHPLEEEIRAEDIVQQELTDRDFQFGPHEAPVSIGITDDKLHLPSSLRVFSFQDLSVAVNNDDDLSLLIRILTKEQPDPDANFLKKTSDNFRSLYYQRELLSVKEGLLYRQVVKPSSSHYAIVIPSGLQFELISRIHSRHGHPGITSTLIALKRAYFFPKMYRSVRKVILNCSLCLQYKGKKDKSYVGSPLDLGVTRPWEMLAIDHFTVGHAPHLKAKFSAVLIGVDVFSGFVITENVKDLTGKETAKSLKSIFERFGAPQSIRSDNGTSFKSSEIKDLLSSFGVHHQFSIPYSPSSNGKIERMVQSVKTRLRILLSDVNSFSKWHQFTQTAAYALNMSIKPSIGFSPRELFLGAPPYIEGSLIYSSPGVWKGNLAEYVAQREAFFDSINKAKWGVIDKSTPRSLPPSLMPGDRCFIRNFQIQASANRALEPKFLGPFSIVRKVNTVTYLVNKDGVNTVVHINNIRPYSSGLDPTKLPVSPNPLPSDDVLSDPPSPPDRESADPSRPITRSMKTDRNPPIRQLSDPLLSPESRLSFPPPPPLPVVSLPDALPSLVSPRLPEPQSVPRGHKRNRDSSSSDTRSNTKPKSARFLSLF